MSVGDGAEAENARFDELRLQHAELIHLGDWDLTRETYVKSDGRVLRVYRQSERRARTETSNHDD